MAVKASSRVPLTIAAAIGSLALILSACSSSSSKSTGSGGTTTPAGTSQASGSSSAAGGIQAQVSAEVQQLLSPPADLGYSAKLSKPVPKNKTVVIMNCAVGACVAQTAASSDAAKALGWKVVEITQGATVQSVPPAWSQAVLLKPDAVITSGIPPQLFQKQVDQLKALNIPVISSTVPQASVGNLTEFDGINGDAEWANAQAKYILFKLGDKANVLNLSDPAVQAVSDQAKQITDTVHKYCSACPSDTLSIIGATDIASGNNVTKIIGYLRSHPGVNVVTGPGSYQNGLQAGLARAGLDTKVLQMVWSPTEVDLSNIQAGKNIVAVGYPTDELGWKAVDITARLFTGDSIDAATASALPRPIITKDSFKSDPFVANYQSLYKAMWGIS